MEVIPGTTVEWLGFPHHLLGVVVRRVVVVGLGVVSSRPNPQRFLVVLGQNGRL